MNLEHKKRWIAAVLGLGVVFGAYYLYSTYAVLGFTILLSVIAFYEFLSFSGQRKEETFVALLAGALLSFRLCTSGQMNLLYSLVALLVLLIHGLSLVHRSNGEGLRDVVQNLGMRSFGLIYLIACPAFIPYIYFGNEQGPALLLLLLFTIWVTDVGAYYGGRWFGVRKLSPHISPGKTLAGSIAGLLSAAILGAAYRHWALTEISLGNILLITALTSLVSQLGDLLESLLKRAYGVKDSGVLLPGHGGVFDRFDSLIFAAPFFYFLLVLLAH